MHNINMDINWHETKRQSNLTKNESGRLEKTLRKIIREELSVAGNKR